MVADDRSNRELVRAISDLTSGLRRLSDELAPRLDRLVNLLQLYQSERRRPRPGSEEDLERRW